MSFILQPSVFTFQPIDRLLETSFFLHPFFLFSWKLLDISLILQRLALYLFQPLDFLLEILFLFEPLLFLTDKFLFQFSDLLFQIKNWILHLLTFLLSLSLLLTADENFKLCMDPMNKFVHQVWMPLLWVHCPLFELIYHDFCNPGFF